jgi:hypothetical protein
MKIIEAKTKNDKIRLVINKSNLKIIIEDNVAELLGNFTSDKDIEYLEKELKKSLEMSSEYETAMWVIETLKKNITGVIWSTENPFESPSNIFYDIMNIGEGKTPIEINQNSNWIYNDTETLISGVGNMFLCYTSDNAEFHISKAGTIDKYELDNLYDLHEQAYDVRKNQLYAIYDKNRKS